VREYWRRTTNVLCIFVVLGGVAHAGDIAARTPCNGTINFAHSIKTLASAGWHASVFTCGEQKEDFGFARLTYQRGYA